MILSPCSYVLVFINEAIALHYLFQFATMRPNYYCDSFSVQIFLVFIYQNVNFFNSSLCFLIITVTLSLFTYVLYSFLKKCYCNIHSQILIISIIQQCLKTRAKKSISQYPKMHHVFHDMFLSSPMNIYKFLSFLSFSLKLFSYVHQ